MNPVAEELQRTIVRVGLASRIREVRALAETAARVLALEGLEPEPGPALPDDDERILTPAERSKIYRRRKRAERHAGVTKSDEPSRTVTGRVTQKVTPRDGFRDAASRAKSEDSLSFSEEPRREEERESDAREVGASRVTKQSDAQQSDASRVTPDSHVRLVAAPVAVHPLAKDFTLTPERRASAEIAGVTDVPDVFREFELVAAKQRWAFDDAGWEAQWELFWRGLLKRQRIDRERMRSGGSGPVRARPIEDAGAVDYGAWGDTERARKLRERDARERAAREQRLFEEARIGAQRAAERGIK